MLEASGEQVLKFENETQKYQWSHAFTGKKGIFGGMDDGLPAPIFHLIDW